MIYTYMSQVLLRMMSKIETEIWIVQKNKVI